MRRVTAFAVVAIVSALLGWHFGDAGSVRAESHGISAISVLQGDGSRFYMVRDGQVMDCQWEPGEEGVSLHPRVAGFVCSPVRIKN